jgi:hypothetical protein
MDAAGNAAVVWGAELASGFAVQVARRPTGGSWSVPDDIAVADLPDAPRVAAGRGGIAVVWQEKRMDFSPVHAAFRPAGGAWDPVTDVSASGHEPDVAFDATGGAFAVWSGDADRIETITHPVAAGGWSSATALGDGSLVALVDSADDRALAIWGGHDVAGQLVAFARERSARGAWRPAEVATTLPSRIRRDRRQRRRRRLLGLVR